LSPWRTVDQPSVEASLQNLIDRAPVMHNGRIILLSDSMYSTVMPPWRFWGDGRIIHDSAPWLPVAPLPQNRPASGQRPRAFLGRYGESHRVEGWLIVARRIDEAAWLGRNIDAHRVEVESFQSLNRTAARYALLDQSP
jgi:hypothetical protein